MSLNKPNMSEMEQHIAKAMHEGLVQMISKKYEAVKKAFIEDLDRCKDAEVAGMALNLERMLQMQSFEDRIVITLIKKDKKDA